VPISKPMVLAKISIMPDFFSCSISSLVPLSKYISGMHTGVLSELHRFQALLSAHEENFNADLAIYSVVCSISWQRI